MTRFESTAIDGFFQCMSHCSSEKEMDIETSVTNFTFFWYFQVSCVDLYQWEPWDPPTFFQSIFTGGTTWKLMKSPSNHKVKNVGGSQRCHQSRSTQDTQQCQKEVKLVTDVSMSISFFGEQCVYLCDYQLIFSAFIKKVCFSDMMYLFSFKKSSFH